MTQIKTVCVDKVAYEAVLRNSVRVNDLEAENHKLKEINLWHSEKSWDCEKEKQQLKELLKECREILEDITEHTDYNEVGIEKLLTKIDNAIGENK